MQVASGSSKMKVVQWTDQGIIRGGTFSPTPNLQRCEGPKVILITNSQRHNQLRPPNEIVIKNPMDRVWRTGQLDTGNKWTVAQQDSSGISVPLPHTTHISSSALSLAISGCFPEAAQGMGR